MLDLCETVNFNCDGIPIIKPVSIDLPREIWALYRINGGNIFVFSFFFQKLKIFATFAS